MTQLEHMFLSMVASKDEMERIVPLIASPDDEDDEEGLDTEAEDDDEDILDSDDDSEDSEEDLSSDVVDGEDDEA